MNRHCLEHVVGGLDVERAESAFGVRQGAAEDGHHVLGRERFEHVDLRP
jgi:hypothetical protein